MTAYIEMNKASCSLDAGFMSLHTVATKYMFYVLVENYLPYIIRWLLSTQFRNLFRFVIDVRGNVGITSDLDRMGLVAIIYIICPRVLRNHGYK